MKLLYKDLSQKLNENRYCLNRKRFLQQEQLLESTVDFSIVQKVMKDLIKNNLIESWVIGGGSALSYYTDPISTIDIDIFIVLKKKSFLIDLSEIYSFLKEQYGAEPVDEMIKIKNVYIQFLVAGDKLTVEATEHPNIVNQIPLFSLEYLIAIMLYVGDRKYKSRLVLVKDEQKYDDDILLDILTRHGLIKKWEMIP